VLNLGHTVGHAIEAATEYAPLPARRGSGDRAAVRAPALRSRRAQREVAELLAARGLPLACEGADPDRVVELVARDKSGVGRRLPFVLVEAPAASRLDTQVPDAGPARRRGGGAQV